jgi:hypothetical protein
MIIEIELPTPHPKQQFLLDNRKRFNVLKCGRRFGKTELCQELILETFENSQYVGYFSPTYKDLHEVWKTTLNTFHGVIKNKLETVKQIEFINGAVADFWSMEDPDSSRGRKYHRVIMDECEKAGKFQQAWEQAIAATLTDYGGDAYFLSTPQFGDTYFKALCKNQDLHPDLWKTFVYTTYDNPHIPVEEIETMKAILHPLVFDCEYMALDVDGKTLNPFAFQYDPAYHENRAIKFMEHRQLYISMDFNINPFAVTFWHHWRDQMGWHWHGIDEVEIANGSIPVMIDYIREKYGNHLHTCIVTGDSMGNQGNIAVRDNASHYISIQRGLGLSNTQMQVPANPSHKNSRNDVNRVLYESKKQYPKFHFLINQEKMPKTAKDMRNVQADVNGSIVKRNRNDVTQRADYLDTVRYLLNLTARPVILKYLTN